MTSARLFQSGGVLRVGPCDAQQAMAFLLKCARAGCTSGSIMVAGDMWVQLCIEHRKLNGQGQESSWDVARTIRWGFAGLTLHGPYNLCAFRLIDRHFGMAASFTTVARKTAFVQATVFPCYLALLFSYLPILEGVRDRRQICQRVQQRVPKAFAGGCFFWPVVNTLNFGVVPPPMRILFVASCGTIWNCFLSYIDKSDGRSLSFSKEPQFVGAQIGLSSLPHCNLSEA